ncbi:unnamed protein product [Cercospora beticola]|nr:unnamed protein product [Cercospora beticola]
MHATLVLPVRLYTTRAPSRLYQHSLHAALASVSFHGEEDMARDNPPETLTQCELLSCLSKWRPRTNLAALAQQLPRAGTNPLGNSTSILISRPPSLPVHTQTR